MPRGDGTIVVRRARDVAALLAFLQPFEPRTSTAIADLLAEGLGRYRCRAWTVEVDGAPGGALVLHRSGFDRWYASCFTADPAAAPALARLVDRSPAWSVSGSGTDIAPLVGSMARERGVTSMPWVVAEPPVTLTTRSEVDERVREASLDDLDELVSLYRDFELASEATEWQLRGTLRQILRRRRLLVLEEDGALVGGLVVSGPTARYVVADGLTVLPEHRSRGVGWTIGARAQAIARAERVGLVAAIASTNPMTFEAANLGPESWAAVRLAAPHPFRGATRLRRLYSRVGRRRSGRERTFVRTDDAAIVRRRDDAVDTVPKTQEGGP